MVGRALFPQSADGGKGAVVDNGLVVVLNDDISECVIELIEDDSIEKGTKIEISIDDYNMNSFL